MELKLGTPIKPMLVSESGMEEERYEKIIKKHKGNTLAEVKSDGHRIQIHKGDEVKFFTRGLNYLNPELFPDVAKQVKQLRPGIYDAEIVGVEDGIRGFRAVGKRMVSELNPELVEQYPLQLKFFDALFLDGKPIIDLPLYFRRIALSQSADNLSEQIEISSPEALRQRYNHVVEDLGLEGLVCKNPESKYKPGGRTSDWIKLKKFLQLDLAILGVYDGEGKVAEQPFAAVVVGTRNGNHYETITKVGVSNKDLVAEIDQAIRSGYLDSPPTNVIFSEALAKKTYSRKVPTQYIAPEKSAVLEVRTMGVSRSKNWHSCGLEDGEAYSLRIPVVERVRYDKRPQDCAKTEQIAELYVK